MKNEDALLSYKKACVYQVALEMNWFPYNEEKENIYDYAKRNLVYDYIFLLRCLKVINKKPKLMKQVLELIKTNEQLYSCFDL